ncbi:uncharacterized protein LOC105767309 [Gossypium raimondii]|uniref:uncharacterized protein LOC105767309 n=1 Tax=Gossypium raimondii TaxID=29730 RepID=UPI00063A9912|nr:uncharacterized protein LOC105767309 [Gossypium raimondii]
MEEEKTGLRLDIDVQKLETEKLRKEKNKAERSWYRNRNSEIELKESLSKIEEMKQRIKELETTLQNFENRIKHLEANENRNKEQLHYFQNQVRSRDHIMEEAVVQIREVADHVQALAVQADMLSGTDKGKGFVLNVEEGDNEGPVYPPDFTFQQVEIYPRRSSVTINPQ